MASFLKTRRGDATGDLSEVAEPPPPATEWSGALHRAIADVASDAGVALDAAAVPEALPHGYGPWAFRVGATDANDTGGLVVRLATDRPDLEREVAAMALNSAHGCSVPAVRGIVELELDDPAGPRFALVTDPVTDVALPELIGFNLHHSNELLDGFAAHHDAIHRLPVEDLPAGGAVPRIDARTELERIDADRYPAERAWLDEHIPSPAPLALAHGGYQPLAVFGPPPEAWPEHGGPGMGLTVVNWCAAALAEPEYDMAFTLVAFWSAPFFAPNRSERTAIKMIRNTLLNTYKQGCTARREVDADRLRFWQAFHALRGMARLDGAYDATGSPFAASDRGAVPLDLGPELHRHFRQLTRVR